MGWDAGQAITQRRYVMSYIPWCVGPSAPTTPEGEKVFTILFGKQFGKQYGLEWQTVK
ncbi:MAG: hypothetical protein SAK29_38880 [Scytonema sp. PMC 1069.18]|nr:hypothetical protein [Scytonema sp. PMC 1069.18]MEC4886349.1 hypothetical protein [Scytonema sp. PMC 1070.18]